MRRSLVASSSESFDCRPRYFPSALARATPSRVRSRFIPLADDRGVDLLVDVGHGRHVAVQVKAVRHTTSSYVFIRKSTFALEPWTVLALVVYGNSLDDQPQVHFVPATEWRSPRPPLTNYDYAGGKSAPEYGLNVRKAWRDELAEWSADSDYIHRLMQHAYPELV